MNQNLSQAWDAAIKKMAMPHEKHIFVINGISGSGKDFLVNSLYPDHYNVMNISTIDPVRYTAVNLGYDGSRDKAARRFLAEMKRLSIEYNDNPTDYAIEETKQFLKMDTMNLLFVHIREPLEIIKYKHFLKVLGCPCKTILVTSPRTDGITLGNIADDSVQDYPYDLRYCNDLPIEAAPSDFAAFITAAL